MNTNTMTFSHASPLDAAITRYTFLAVRAVQSAFDWLNSPSDHEPRTAAELLVWADQYEETQPSYAADLRAAAMRTQG
ncbi:MAG: hypothetical protein AB9M53_01805 [Leptothrix sp. (in: b-proteobacteria)]